MALTRWIRWWGSSGPPGRVRFDPGPRQLEVPVGAVLPGEMARVEDVELAFGQALVQELGVGRRHQGVVAAGDELNRSLDVTEPFGQDRQVSGIAADVCHRLNEAVACIRAQVVLAHGLEQGVSLDAIEGPSNDLAYIEGLIATRV